MAEIPAALKPTEPVQAQAVPNQIGNTPVVSPTGQPDLSHVPLYDHKNNTIVTVPYHELETYLQTPQYTMQKGAKLNVVSPDGEYGTIDAKDVHGALTSGYKIELPEETHSRKVQAEFGGVGGQLAAGAAGLARGATFGLSDQLMTKTGAVAPETLSGLEEANPMSSTIGEGAGLVGSALLTGGESVGAKIASAGIRGTEAAGAVTARVLEKQALKAGLSNPVAKSIAEKIIPAAAGSAVEGAFFGGGQLLSEEALGKADLNAENLAAYIGTGALLNGAFGAAFAGAKELAGPVSQAAKYVTSPFASKVSAELDSKVGAAKLLGLTEVQLQKLEKRNPKVIKDMEDYLRDDLKLGLTDTAETLSNKNTMVRETSGTEIGSVLKEIDATLEQMPLFKPSASSVWEPVYNRVYTAVENLLEKDIPGMEKYQKPINNFLDDVARLGKSERKFTATDLQRFKKGLDELIKYEKEPGKWSVLEEMAYEARTAVRDEIDKLAQRMETLGGADNLADRLRVANRQYAASATFGDFLEKRMLKSAGKEMTLTGTAVDVANDLKRKLLVLGKIEQGNQLMNRAVQGTVKAFGATTRGLQVASQTAVPSIVNSGLAVDYSGDKPSKPKGQTEAYNNILNNLNSFTQSPPAFLEKVNRQTASLYPAAPQTSGQLDNLAMTAMTYLSTKLPKRQANMTLLSPYVPVPPPSSQELAKFARILQAVEKPAVVMKHLGNGTASREEIDVLKEVYPATFQKLQETFMQELPKLKDKMPYNRRIQLGLLLGVPADASMMPEHVLGLQQLFGQSQQPQQQQGGGAVKQTVSGMKELDKSNPMKTAMQEVQTGRED